MQYKTTQGRTYDFSGWEPGESPLELFDKQEWLKCLHACMLCTSFTHKLYKDDLQTQDDIAAEFIDDDGLLHELCHRACGLDICTHNSLEDLRKEVRFIQYITKGYLERAKTALEGFEN